MIQMDRAAGVAAAAVLALAMAGCASHGQRPYAQQRQAYPQGQVYQNQADPYGTRYGTVVAVEGRRNAGAGSTSGVGAVAGGVAGGVIGNQVGGGTGRALATIAGVVVGALAGNAVEQQSNRGGSDQNYVTVRFDDGAQQVYSVPSLGGLRNGERVRVYQGQITRM
ncbi:MAG: hypothetical protein BGO13_06805 [Burkholderiales bacterium 66-5]|uniref:glycine zipper 2TM domain-containing protein n=1 Tax=Comamonas badia TaxID=265291 RepID=UPI000400B97D|nr:glycine zipper 2TM domain-containing protein [Comamonas badia]OJU87307.1 MAG: hypothetical protein BGO13_06805 [Burkholderiales bacterium 66-5]